MIRRSPGKSLKPIVGLVGALLLGGCSGGNVLDDLGLTPPVPNAFLVTTEPPLSMPPSLTSLPSPEPGVVRPQAVPPRLQAEETLVPEVALAGDAGPDSPGQRELVAASGPPAPADIREELTQQAARDRPGQGVLAWMLFWKPTPLPGVVVDPVREARRLQENAALGRPPTYGQTPIVQPKQEGLF